METVTQQAVIDNSSYKAYAGVRFINGTRTYYFGVYDFDYKLEEKVVVETMRGMELGLIVLEPIDIKKYKSELGLKPILRKATDADLRAYDSNIRDAKFAMEVCQAEITRLNLDMNLISCEYTLDKTKVLFSYLADERVDFRELLKVLAAKLHTRIDLRQVGSRDKAKMVGGIGICGLPLCCSTFLNEFDGISINRAKNQMLAINIPKLSGQCGKLICCLKYEDDAYTEDKKAFPELGTKVFIEKIEYTVTNINIVSRVVRVENEEDIKIYSLDDYNKEFKLPKKDFKKDIQNQNKDKQNEKPQQKNPAPQQQNKNNEQRNNQQQVKNNQNNQQNNNQQRNNNQPRNNNQHRHNNYRRPNGGQNEQQNKQNKERTNNNEKK